MYEYLWRDAAILLGTMHLVAPMVVRNGFRFAAHCNPVQVPVEESPREVSAYIQSQIPQMQSLGFEFLGCYDCGVLAGNTRNFIAYFCNRQTNEFANVSVATLPQRTAGYFEFSTRFGNGQTLETNTNGILPLTPGNPQVRVFRFPEIEEPRELYRVHRCLTEKYAKGQWAQGEPKGQEIQRLVRVVENYGPRHAKMGYMCLAPSGETYFLTWKGAILMTWRGLWPMALIRRAINKFAMRSELQSLHVRGVPALQKA
ncbi:MAG TPA: hypothetical protein VN830_10475 [Verrucomicrobiae bacterium]|nr:hypothetical protein [Verrucomicrobiae bacterium]